ncbi:RND efflux system, outer membrane lipoprotein, NodT family [Novosphingobium nitrogenifigens DSM 19370]|uniref:RND efflux system, outer membrane lipoprotein, NodT family n=1 Tax=Novosphingobium nitrogenifigens DSM 19370 TaxID=983920 RepID=F1ZAM7_9SPHN|nr:RND efflux system, outer membrane lipoprotein, NodT family [Novosphingobium nitrogenifigens DSM 19370]
MLALSALSALVGGCSMAPTYHVPTSVTPTPTFKADPGWAVAQPSDDAAKGAWWTLFGDDTLNGLEARVLVTNQNLAYYRAAYAQALATVRVDRAALLPTASGSAGVTHQDTFASGSKAVSTFSVTGSASWVPDLWGNLTNTTRAARAQAEASAAELANATLSAQGTLASDYFALRGIDAQAVMLDATIVSYRRSLEVTRNKFAAGTVSSADVDTARTTLANAEASRRDLDRQRAAYEAAIAVLVGENPSTFSLAQVTWHPVVPDVPGIVPSAVLERRPDIANAERLVAAANANIGVAKAAFFPTVTLTASGGSQSSTIGSLFGASTSLWSLGASAAETLIDWGARSAKVRGARAAYDASVATYRQTVLNAFQEVESDLAAVGAYRAEDAQYATASQSADRAETVTRNQYQAGTVDFTSVTQAQATAYTARVNLILNTVYRQTTAVALIQAIGGQWTGSVDLHPTLPAPQPSVR